MAERRMFSKSIVLSDAFLDMPMSARCLYFTLGMLADDDGFVDSPKSIMRQCGASIDDMNILINKNFTILMDDGIVVIRHWRIHNYIQADRYTPTRFQELKSKLGLDESKMYTECIQDVSSLDTQVRIGKESTGKVNKKFVPPTLEEITAYCKERGKGVDPQQVYDYYTEMNWVDNLGHPVQNWKGKIVAVWEKKYGNTAPSRNICNDAKEIGSYATKNGGLDFDVLQ